jgi:DNA-binding beta-propeller fold protein YncE
MNSLLALLLGTTSAGAPQPRPPESPVEYRLTHEIPIDGEGGWDYLAVDPEDRRLYLSHATRVVVVDLAKNTVVGEIAHTPGVHGFAIAHDLHRGFSSNGKESKVSVVDLTTLETVMQVETGANPDCIVYEPSKQEVYAFNGKSHSATVFNARSGAVVATIALAGKPEFAAVDAEAHRVFVNIEDKNTIAAIDTGKHEVVASWPIAPGEGASGMAIDLQNHRLFVGCENKQMLMVDSTSGKVLASVPIGGRVDANAFDPERHLAFSSNGEGTVTIAREDAPSALGVVQTLATKVGSRTMALDPKTHAIYLPAAEFDPPAPDAGERPRPQVRAGTLKLQVYEPVK